MKYKPSEVSILVHVGRPTTLSANPSEIGTVSTPVDEGTSVQINATLVEKGGSPIANKILHLYKPDGTEIGTGLTTDVNGQATFTYTAAIVDDGLQLKIKYLGD